MSTLALDLRYALRNLRHAPSFSALVLFTLALGIGASTAIFSAVNEVMLRPLAVRDPARLVMLWESNEGRGWNHVDAAPGNVMDWRDHVKSFEDVAMATQSVRNVALTTGRATLAVNVGQLSGNALTLLGAVPAVGRLFTMEETWFESAPVVVLGHATWVRHFAADPAIVGQMVRLDGVSFQVVGVLPRTFQYPINEADVFTTYRWTTARRAGVWFRQAHVVRAFARLRTGATLEQARSELTAVASRLEQQRPATNRGMKAGATPLQEFLVGDRRFPLLLLLCAVGLLQLIVCANVANLLLARALTRRQEMAVRVALGATRLRIASQVLTESFCLTAIGAVAGLLLGSFSLDAIAAMRPVGLPDLAFHLDWRVLAFTTGVATLSALLFGVQPALASAGVAAQQALAEGGRTGSVGRKGLRTAHALTALEVALAVVLLSGAGLMLRSVGKLREVPSGVNMSNVLTFELNPPSGKYRTDDAKGQLVQLVLERLQQVRGVRHAGAGRTMPFAGLGWSGDFTVDGWPADRFGTEVRHREATAGYFHALEVPVRKGSLFPDHVPAGAALPVVVNQAFAERYFARENAVGRRLVFDRVPDSTSRWYEIVGVVGNERLELTSEPQPEIISHLVADMPGLLRFVVKTTVPPASLVPAVRTAIGEIDPELPLLRVRTLETAALDALAADRFLMVLLGVFAAVALMLAAVGVYGVASQATRLRTREVGIRLALGATARDVVQTVAIRGVGYVGVGLVLGIGGTLVVGRFLRTLLFRVEPTDPTTLACVAFLLLLVALVAALAPARRAARGDPMRVLGTE